ncbi:QueT transporter family protein [Fusibacter paucivorans]|uniref:QueT transporter family protein n=1 Tax=Fusibacter paucivorans TaxID=76009 RepID=A0ABS5PKJ1_9FIRM|nr:QueT transporter family protein [Fusibacter paucivorans]MBS7525367.1 QueT transporter family protein [Fusibacter paucivorans]
MIELIQPFAHKRGLVNIIIVAMVFAFMAVPFKAMTLVEGFTEVRPVNAVPIVAGLLFGPAGAWGCGIGNVIADLFGDFSWYSVLGFVGNFAAAYVPYRIWHIIRGEEMPNVKTHANLLLYVYLSVIGAMATSILIGCGLDVFFGFWSWELFFIIFCNDFLFPVFLGLPVLIVFTSDDHQFEAYTAKWTHAMLNTQLETGQETSKKAVYRNTEKMICRGFAFATIGIFAALNFGCVMSSEIWLMLLGVVMCVGIIGLMATDQ